MKITAIKQQVKQAHRYSLFVDGKYSFSLSETALLDSGLANGQELDAAAVEGYKKLSGDDKLYNLALQYSVIRPRSTWEMESYLLRKKADPLLCRQILNRLSELKFVDDRSFALSWVSSRRLLKPVSYRKLDLELKQKHVSQDIIDSVLSDDETDERDTIRQLIDKKRRQSKYQDNQKLMQFLARQGFGYNDIKAAMSETEDLT